MSAAHNSIHRSLVIIVTTNRTRPDARLKAPEDPIEDSLLAVPIRTRAHQASSPLGIGDIYRCLYHAGQLWDRKLFVTNGLLPMALLFSRRITHK